MTSLNLSAMARFTVTALLATPLLSSCGGSEDERRFKTPIEGVIVLYRVGHGAGGLAPNVSDVFVELKRDGETDKKLVLHGTYLEVDSIRWSGLDAATICLKGGYTSEFHNRVTLNEYVSRKNVDIHFFLREDCASSSG